MQWGFDADREAAWQTEKIRLYAAWRERKMQAGLAHLASTPDHATRMTLLEAVSRKYGKRFAEDLRDRFFREFVT